MRKLMLSRTRWEHALYSLENKTCLADYWKRKMLMNEQVALDKEKQWTLIRPGGPEYVDEGRSDTQVSEETSTWRQTG